MRLAAGRRAPSRGLRSVRGRRSPAALRALTLVSLTALLAVPAPPLSAQYLEPIPRRPGVTLPPEALAAQAERAREVGIVSLEDAAAGRAPLRAAREGTLRLVVILALFADSPEPHVSPEDVARVLFEGPTAQGTLTEYYREVSAGALEVTGFVTPWVRTGVPIRDAAGEQDGHGFIGERIGDYVLEALGLAEEHVDFSEFDTNGNGNADGVAVRFLEVAGACGGPGVWPHFGGLSRWTGNPRGHPTSGRGPDGSPVHVPVYFVDSVTDCGGAELQGIEIFAHELGHLLGLPDHYRAVDGILPHQRHWAVGCFDLMAAGGWGCGTGLKPDRFGPPHLSAFSRWRLGWLELQEVERARDEEFVLGPVQTTAHALRVPLAPGSPESFVLEYRPRVGFDAVLPDDGVLIYHVDLFQGLRAVPPGLPPPYPLHLVEADGDDALRKVEAQGGNRGVAADYFARAGADDALDASTTPSTRNHYGEPGTLVVHSVRVDGGMARVRLSAGSDLVVAETEIPEAAVALAPFEGSVRVSGAAGTLEVGVEPVQPHPLPEGIELAAAADGARVTGVPLQAGRFEFSVVFRDGEGGLAYQVVRIHVQDAPIADERLLEGLLAPGSGALSAGEVAYLDASGNRNGGFDVGDLRARIRRQRIPGLPR